MGVLSSMFTGVSGLQAQGEALWVLLPIISQMPIQTGFKASRAEFQDIVAKNLKGILGGNQIGRGVKIGAVNPILAQGNLDSTENATDLAISGDGYFVSIVVPTVKVLLAMDRSISIKTVIWLQTITSAFKVLFPIQKIKFQAALKTFIFQKPSLQLVEQRSLKLMLTFDSRAEITVRRLILKNQVKLHNMLPVSKFTILKVTNT